MWLRMLRAARAPRVVPVGLHKIGAVTSAASNGDQRPWRLEPVRASLPRLPAAFLAVVRPEACFLPDAVFSLAFFFVVAALLAAVLGAAFAAAFFGAAFPAAFFAIAFLGATCFAAFGAAFFFGADFLTAAFAGAGCAGGAADGESSPEEVSTVSVPGPGITIVSSFEGQRTRSIDPTSAVTTPSRSGPLPDVRRIR